MSSRIRGFLLVHPKPHTVRVSSGDGESQEISIANKSYAKVAETIAALQIDLVECIDKDGKILRALRVGAADTQRSDAAEVPAAIAADPHALMISHFANLLHRAYEHSTEIAFGKLVELVDRMGDRAEAIEQRLERAETQYRKSVEQQIQDAFERADEAAEKNEEGGLVDRMAGAFLSGQIQQTVKPGAKNGAPKGQG